MNARKYDWLDVTRGLAALSVAIFHFRFFAPGDVLQGSPNPSQLPLYGLLSPFFNFGYLAVPYFWALSGFVFANVYLDRRPDARSFFVSRFARLYPLHFVTLLLVAGLQWASMSRFGHFSLETNNTVSQFVLQLFLANNWVGGRVLSFNTPIWSVSVEVLIYLVFFGFLMVRRSGGLLLPAALALFAGGIVLFDIPVLTAGFLFFAGQAILLFTRHFPGRVSLLAGAAGLGVAVAAYLFGAGVTRLNILSMPSLLMIFAALEDTRFRPPRALVNVGQSTYSIYLLQFPLILAVTVMAPGMVDSRNALSLGVYLLFLIGLSLCVYRFFEAPAKAAILAWSRPRSGTGHQLPGGEEAEAAR